MLSLFDKTTDRSTFNILVVCTGNICRSPLVESLLRNELSRLPVQVSSAGTHALVGQPMHAPVQKIADEFELPDPGLHVAQQLTIGMLKESDLILAMDRGHRREIVEMLPRVSRYTFALREFARLADQVSNEDIAIRSGHSSLDLLRGVVESVAQLRGTLPLLDDPSQEDVIDPYGKDQATYRLSVGQLLPAADASARLFNDAVGEI
ncbi:low molecular weight phosphatase family protein [Glutamicibacter nicotianae]|uniref:arsenate reductase/protein-tyrosine-phosphatase family protein n=1 Tax=Glutamicibacter nicotianae TaxID=37929 RepID=UPI0025574E90|nr:low molecular weight phosphatase family protein [Glutamicibacter nicotianae]WIV45299.1 low molecular weight phosphatase family protein [Glutamicibacter nicotianae]